MFIVPLTSSITPMETISQKKQTEGTDDGEATFFDVFESLVKTSRKPTHRYRRILLTLCSAMWTILHRYR